MESNLNLELIEKVKNAKASIYFKENDSVEKLRQLYKAISPNTKQVPEGLAYYYWLSEPNTVIVNSSDGNPYNYEIIPLSAFFTNELPKEDLDLIAQIDARLKRLEDIYFSKGEEPKKPIEQVEQPKEEVKERYGINVCANHSRFDVRVYGIETESQAIELKDKIKALLQTL